MKITKAILTGGGRATRLWPVTTTTNKHLLPLANKPMIVHAIEKVAAAGVTDIFINTNPGDTSLPAALGDGSRYGVRITYYEQTGGPQGIAHVVNEGKKFIGDDPFLFYLSDNILLGDIASMLQEFDEKKYDCMLAFSRVPDPERFGVPYFDEQGKLVNIVEKPKDPPNNFAVTGLYIYGPKIFFDTFTRVHKSARGEYEISDVHSLFLKDGKKVGYIEVSGYWKDTGKPSDLLLANKLLLDQMHEKEFSNDADIDPSVRMTGNIHIGAGTKVGKGVVMHGPLIVGQGCVLEQCEVGPHVTIGSHAVVKGAQIENSIILPGGHITGGIHLIDSLLGHEVNISSSEASRRRQRMIVGDKTVVDIS